MATEGRGDVELIDDGDDVPRHQDMPWPHIRKADLYSHAGDVIRRRLRDYLCAMGVPPALAEAWGEQACRGDAAQAFARLRMLISEHAREGAETTLSGIGDASVSARLWAWLEPGHMPCPPRFELFDTPPVDRRSMAPERWDD